MSLLLLFHPRKTGNPTPTDVGGDVHWRKEMLLRRAIDDDDEEVIGLVVAFFSQRRN